LAGGLRGPMLFVAGISKGVQNAYMCLLVGSLPVEGRAWIQNGAKTSKITQRCWDCTDY